MSQVKPITSPKLLANASVLLESKETDATEYVSQIETGQGYIRMFANASAVTKVGFYEKPISENTNTITSKAKQQMLDYLAGKLQQFDLPLAPQGTAFQRRVWQQLLAIDYGKTASYLDIASAIQNPKACRAVGAANGKNPIAIVIPCHRIIGSNGSLTGYAGGLARKTFLLDLEQS